MPDPLSVSTDWSDLVDIHERLNSTIMFTLIRFVYGVVATRFSDAESGVLCLVAIIVSGVGMHLHLHPGSTLLFQVVFSLTSALFSQAVINLSTNPSRLQNAAASTQLIFDFVVVTSLLLGAAVLPARLRSMPYINRAITLLLYMYTDATEFMIMHLSLGIVATFLCILLYISIIRYKTLLANHVSLEYLVKALNMVTINVVLASAGTINHRLSDRYTQAVLIVIILFIVDALHRVTGVLREGRDFAVWKGSKLLFDIYASVGIDTMATLSVAAIFLIVKHVVPTQNSTAVEVSLLVTVNVILDDLAQYTTFAYNMDKVLTLFMYTIVIHCVSNAVADHSPKTKSEDP